MLFLNRDSKQLPRRHGAMANLRTVISLLASNLYSLLYSVGVARGQPGLYHFFTAGLGCLQLAVSAFI